MIIFKVNDVVECCRVINNHPENVIPFWRKVVITKVYENNLYMASRTGYDCFLLENPDEAFNKLDSCWFRALDEESTSLYRTQKARELLGFVEQTSNKSLSFKYCDHCRTWFVECPECGNNACNGTYGKNGECGTCEIVYAIQDLIANDERNHYLSCLIRDLLIKINEK